MYASRAKHASRGIHERDDKRAIWLEMGCYVGKKRVHRLIGEIVHTKVTDEIFGVKNSKSIQSGHSPKWGTEWESKSWQNFSVINKMA